MNQRRVMARIRQDAERFTSRNEAVEYYLKATGVWRKPLPHYTDEDLEAMLRAQPASAAGGLLECDPDP